MLCGVADGLNWNLLRVCVAVLLASDLAHEHNGGLRSLLQSLRSRRAYHMMLTFAD